MSKRKSPDEKEYNPLDDVHSRLPIDSNLIDDVLGAPKSAPQQQERPRVLPQLSVVEGAKSAEPPEDVQALEARVVEKLTHRNKFHSTPSEKIELERLASRLSGALGVNVRPSNLLRACLINLLNAEEQIIERAESEKKPISRPTNTEAVSIAEFDQRVAEILSHAFRRAKALGSTSNEKQKE